jgi:GTP-binding protein HflX
MTKLRRELKALEATRRTQRAAREASGISTVALAGYTNAGKSSVLNALTGAGVLVQDALFATLDPTVRKLRAPSGKELTIADTVGFVRHLPHDLVEAFRSTLTEVQEATLIVHVVDGCDEDPFGQISAVREVLNEIGAGEIPELIAINKSDIADPMDIVAIQGAFPESIVVSAHTGAGLEELLARIDTKLPQTLVAIDVTIPYSRGDLISRIHESGEQVNIAHVDTGSDVSALVPAALAADIERQGFLRAG